MKMNGNGTIKLVLLFQVGLLCVGLELVAFSPNTWPKVNPCLHADWSPSWNNNGRPRLSSRSMSDTQRDAWNDKYFTISADNNKEHTSNLFTNIHNGIGKLAVSKPGWLAHCSP